MAHDAETQGARTTLNVLLGVMAGSLFLFGTAWLILDPAGHLHTALLEFGAAFLVLAAWAAIARRPLHREGLEWATAAALLLGVALQSFSTLQFGSDMATPVLAIILAATGGFLSSPLALTFVVACTSGAWAFLRIEGALTSTLSADVSILFAGAAVAVTFQASRRFAFKRLRQHRDALVESELRFRQIAEGVHEVFWLQDLRTKRFLYVSPRFEDTWGRDPQDVVSGKVQLADTLHPEDRARIAAMLRTRKPDAAPVEYRIVRPDGATRWIRERAYVVGRPGAERVVGLAEDVTERKALEDRYRALFHSMPTPAWVYDRDALDILEVNDAALVAYGYTREEFLGMTLADLKPQAEAERFLAEWNAMDGNDVRQIEARHVRVDKTVFDVMLTAAPFDAFRPGAALAVCQDISERNRVNDAARRNDRLASLGTLVAGVAHEINNPLTYMRGNIELIDLDLDDAGNAASLDEARTQVAAARDKLVPVLRGMEQIAHITKSLKQVARKPADSRERADLREIAKNALVVAMPRFPEGTVVATQLDQSVPAHAMSSEIGQVVLNLLFNAADALADHDAPQIELRAWEDANGAHVLVRDNGPGIPQAAHARVFMPFHTTKPHGTGLGLSTSLAIARAHDGDLIFESRPGEGTSFILTLPAAAAGAS